MADGGKAEFGMAMEVIELEGKRFEMQASLKMAIHFANGPGGISGGIERLFRLHFDTIVESVRLACTPKLDKVGEDRLRAAIYDAGLKDCADKCIPILTALAHGGRKAPEEEESEEGGDGEASADPLAGAASD